MYQGEAVNDLKIVRTGRSKFAVEFTVPDDGTGAGAQVEVRSAPNSAGAWWWGKTETVTSTLLTTAAGEYEPGSRVRYPVDAGIDLDGVQTQFRAVAFRYDEVADENHFSEILPPDPGLLFEFGEWVEPELLVVQQQFTVETPVDGDVGVAIRLTWASPLDRVVFFVNGTGYEPVDIGLAGDPTILFVALGRSLVEGETLEIYSVAYHEGRESEPYPPHVPYRIRVAAKPAPAEEPGEDEDEPPEPPTDSTVFPVTTEATFPANADEFYLDVPDAEPNVAPRRMKFGRLWKWLSFGWFGVYGIYLAKEE